MDKQKEILAAALKLFVEFGFHGTPTSKIAKEAGVANGTLFHYYATKDELIISLYIALKLQMAAFIESKASVGDNDETRFRKQFEYALYWGIEHKAEFQYMQQLYASPYVAMIHSEEIQKQLEKSCNQIQEAIDKKIIKPFPVDYIFTIIGSHLFGLNQYLRNSNFPVKKQKEVISETFDLLWDMLT
ncbi:MAG TPA: TetR/AcrR family transcriptional regulator [Flavobacterium sp.]|nr:TetR/AcrR family transcriptional regulator [Flavobacterium sp.]